MSIHAADEFQINEVTNCKSVVIEIKPWGVVTASDAEDMMLDFVGPAVTIKTRPATAEELILAEELYQQGKRVILPHDGRGVTMTNYTYTASINGQNLSVEGRRARYELAARMLWEMSGMTEPCDVTVNYDTLNEGPQTRTVPAAKIAQMLTDKAHRDSPEGRAAAADARKWEDERYTLEHAHEDDAKARVTDH